MKQHLIDLSEPSEQPNPYLIDLTRPTDLHSVWELIDGYWELLTIVRLRCAITLALQSPLTRLVFATIANPSGVWGGIYDDNRTTLKEERKAESLFQKRHRLVLELLKASPGQTKEAIAVFLDISVATARQLLRSLEDLGNIHSRPHPSQNRTKLYYMGTAPVDTNRGAAASNSNRSARSTPSSPPLKVYFVDPRTLQSLNR